MLGIVNPIYLICGNKNRTIMGIKDELKAIWKTVCSVSRNKANKKYEGVPCEWKDFDDFYKCNYQRYYKAKKKWENYKRIVSKPELRKTDYEVRNICFIRKVKEKGYTKSNTVFTSLSDRMKFHKTSKKIILNGTILGTRDIKNILSKKGIPVSGINVISKRMADGLSPFMKENRLKKFKHNGSFKSLKDIANEIGVKYSLLSNKIFKDKMDLCSAIDFCKQYKEPTYHFEGNELYPQQIAEIIGARIGVNPKTILSRFYSNDCDISKITYLKSNSKFAPYKKKVSATKGDECLIFNSISDLCKELKLNRPSVNNYLKGKLKNTNQTKGYHLSYE